MQWLYRIQPLRPGMLSEGPIEEEDLAVKAGMLKGDVYPDRVALAGKSLPQ